LTPGFRIHTGAMAFSVKPANDTVFVEGQTAETGQLTRNHHSLIEPPFTFPVGVERHRNDQIGGLERSAHLHLVQQQSQTPRYARFPLQFQYRCPQRALVTAASAGGVERIVVAPSAPHAVAPICIGDHLT
jgi:hypothetical protein